MPEVCPRCGCGDAAFAKTALGTWVNASSLTSVQSKNNNKNSFGTQKIWSQVCGKGRGMFLMDPVERTSVWTLSGPGGTGGKQTEEQSDARSSIC